LNKGKKDTSKVAPATREMVIDDQEEDEKVYLQDLDKSVNQNIIYNNKIYDEKKHLYRDVELIRLPK
jgi:hypothetical protein